METFPEIELLPYKHPIDHVSWHRNLPFLKLIGIQNCFPKGQNNWLLLLKSQHSKGTELEIIPSHTSSVELLAKFQQQGQILPWSVPV